MKYSVYKAGEGLQGEKLQNLYWKKQINLLLKNAVETVMQAKSHVICLRDLAVILH